MNVCIKFFFTSVNDRTNYPVIRGFDRTKPIFDRTLSVDRPLFQALYFPNGLKVPIYTSGWREKNGVGTKQDEMVGNRPQTTDLQI